MGNKKKNIVVRLQDFMDSVKGKTIMNYLYSWGASIVILGALFKLTHIEGANLMLFLGMGTEVIVFFFFAFDRPFEVQDEDEEEAQPKGATAGGGVGYMGGPAIIGGGAFVGSAPIEGEPSGEVAASGNANVNLGDDAPTHIGVAPSYVGGGGGGPVYVGGGAPAFVGGGGPIYVGGGAVGGGAPIIIGNGGSSTGTNNGESVSNISDGEAATQQPVAGTSGPVVLGGGVVGGGVLSTGTFSPEIDEVTQEYVDKIRELTEALQHVADQSSMLERNMEEMELLGRNLTGINTIYEMQLRSVSAQVGNIDQVNEQTRKMADQIEELNKVYARMLEAMTVNMRNQQF